MQKSKLKKILKIFTLSVSIILIIVVIIMFKLGYKIPHKDKHPDWSYFPNTTNSKFVIKKIGIDYFDKNETKNNIFDRYFLDRTRVQAVLNTDSLSLRNLKNIKSLGKTVLCNNLYVAPLIYIDANSSGSKRPGYKTQFDQIEMEYLSINIGNETTFFKNDISYNQQSLGSFYQINEPKNNRDTLYFIYQDVFYLAYLKSE